MDVSKVLFIDTESNPTTKEPESLQWLLGSKMGIITDFDNSYFEASELWNKAEAIVMFNAPYDLGVLSIMFAANSYRWVDSKQTGSYWEMNIFDNVYNVRKLGFHRNMIKPLKQRAKTKNRNKRPNSKPVIDLLKLWSILIDDGRGGNSISLKALIKRVLGKEAIPYSEANAKTDTYRYQDVVMLKELAEYFFRKVSSIDDLNYYNYENWCYIKTPATFTKLSYEDSYDIFQAKPNKIMSDRIGCYDGLAQALEEAFNGGITLSFYRGTLNNTGWIDISGAYVHAIEYLNTDSYILADIIHHTDADFDYKKPNVLLEVETNFVIKSINKSLKLFRVKEPCTTYMWYSDIESCGLLDEKFDYRVLSGYEFIPEHMVTESLPTRWSRMKDIEKNTNGKTTLYDFYKFKGNTSYGITAQRKPFSTKFTNMIIAGMITSTVHRILATINHTINNCPIDGVYRSFYNDTDSACFMHSPDFNEYDMNELVSIINSRIAPYKVESEGFGKVTTFLSLKRYISEGGTDKDKIKLHGKGRYNVKQEDIYNYVIKNQLPEKQLRVTQLAANTQRGMNQILKIYPYIEPFKHPFMFVTDVPTEHTMEEFFYEWYTHIDTKTSFKTYGSDFLREFHTFDDIGQAIDYFQNYFDDCEPDYVDKYDDDFDKMDRKDFKD